MEGKKINERLRFDVKFLLWRAEVYALSPQDIEVRFDELRREYAQLAEGPYELRLVEQQLRDWHPIITALASTAKSA
ncbi:hypothetical protein [Motiliproteus sediminis]|uniref:hypothetical protein n=1 Tax=Motiliproteus sediminis TaxID=1468178 RepID=UPI001AEFB110|nr:hypothetical protein [Motiliproteus sediminis]